MLPKVRKIVGWLSLACMIFFLVALVTTPTSNEGGNLSLTGEIAVMSFFIWLLVSFLEKVNNTSGESNLRLSGVATLLFAFHFWFSLKSLPAGNSEFYPTLWSMVAFITFYLGWPLIDMINFLIGLGERAIMWSKGREILA